MEEEGCFPQKVFHIDETGLFWKMPRRTCIPPNFTCSVHLKTSTPPHIFIFLTPAHLSFDSNIAILPTGLHYIRNIKYKKYKNNSPISKRL
jgi:hypothetical protein